MIEDLTGLRFGKLKVLGTWRFSPDGTSEGYRGYPKSYYRPTSGFS